MHFSKNSSFEIGYHTFQRSLEICKYLPYFWWSSVVLLSANTVTGKTEACILVIGISHCLLKLLFSFTDGEEKTYGGCEGPDAMYVKLISSDGHEFIVKREHALTSGTIKAMLSGPGKYNRCNTLMSFSFSVGLFEFLSYSGQKLEQIITCSDHY